jgi:Phage tail protein
VYRAGLDSLVEDYPHFSRASLLFRATDPYWHDGVYQVRDFVPSELVTEWFPIFPLSIAPTNVFGEFSVNNNGDADAWPEVDVQGPGDDFRFTNMTTDRFLAITGNIPAGGTLKVTTEPGNRGVSLGAENWFNRLERGSSLWQLVPGFNTLRVQFRTEASRVAIRWRLRYLTP